MPTGAECCSWGAALRWFMPASIRAIGSTGWSPGRWLHCSQAAPFCVSALSSTKCWCGARGPMSMCCSRATSGSPSSLVPNFLTTVTLLRPEQIGLLMLTYGAVPMIVTVPLTIFLLRHIDPRWILIFGLSAFAVANLLGTELTHDWARVDFVPIAILQSIGQAFTLFPAILLVVSNSDFSRATAFAAYIQITRLGGAEIGVSFMGTWLRIREQ